MYICKPNKITFQASTNPKIAVVVSNASIKNQVTTFIVHVHTYNSSVIKMIHHATNVTLTETELFAIRCSINQAIQLSNIN